MDVSVRRMRKWARATLGLQIVAGRGMTVYPDDTFLVSYPKSGSIWTCFLVSNLIFPDEPTTFLNLRHRTPDVNTRPDPVLRRFARPRFLKSELCFEPRYKRVVYLVRDPRDVAVSYYHHRVRRMWIPDGYPLRTFVKEWMEPRWDGDYGTWGEHVKSWLAPRGGSDGFLLVRYEDLQARTNEELARIVRFLGLKRSDEEISRAVNLSSADRMRALEKAQRRKSAVLGKSRPDKAFVRKAKAGGWRAELPRESVELIEAAWGPLMEELGYPIGEKALNAEPDSPSVVRST